MKILVSILKEKGLKIFNESDNADSLVFECDVYAKPGSKKESVVISADGQLVIKTNARPIEGEANKSIVEMVAKFLSVSKSNIAIIRGDKSKNKRIKILVETTANKSKKFYQEKFTSISKEEV